MKLGDEVTIAPTELVAGGDALAKIDGFPIFTSNIFPGDVAVVRLFEVKKGFARGELVRLIQASPWRRAEPCPVAEECGGCDWTALRLDKQLEAKQRILTESLRRIGKFDVAQLPPVTMHPSPLNYRIRSRLHREGDAVGFYAMRSNRVVQLSDACEVVGVQPLRGPVDDEGARRHRHRLPVGLTGLAQVHDARGDQTGGRERDRVDVGEDRLELAFEVGVEDTGDRAADAIGAACPVTPDQ